MKVNPKHIRVFDPLNYYITTDGWNDLLRYDLGFVKKGGSGVVIFPKIVAGKAGAYSHGPTLDRWASYGFQMTEVEGERREQILFDFSSQVGQWVTMRRVHGHKPGDQPAWVEVPLSQFLRHKDIYEMDVQIAESLKRHESEWPYVPAPVIEQ